MVHETRPSLDWPQHGCVDFRNYATQYRPGLPLVLKDLNCHISAGEKVIKKENEITLGDIPSYRQTNK